MIKFVGTRILVLFLALNFAMIASEPLEIPDDQNDSVEPGISAAYFPRDRTKRVAKILASLVNEGIEAATRLKFGSTKVKSPDQGFQKYEKQGGYLRAVQDFYAVRPQNVNYFQHPNMIFGRIGTVGDKTIILEGKIFRGKATEPTIKILDSAEINSPDAFHEIIKYVNGPR